MRPGPKYSMQIDRSHRSGPKLNIPLEVANDFDCCDYVVWTENPDGTYTIELKTNYN